MLTPIDRLKASTRMVLFETGYEGWEYSTNGGTVFLVAYEGKPYAITARHVAHTYDWKTLCVMDRKSGSEIAGLKAVSFANGLFGDAEGTDFGDVVVVEFSPDIDSAFFGGDIYPLDETTTSRADTGDALLAYCVPKEKTEIKDGVIRPTFAALGFVDDGPHAHDAFLRTCFARWAEPGLTSLSGLSGSPVFNSTKGVLCGVMVRGGIQGRDATGKYLDIDDVLRLVRCVHQGETATNYTKTVKVRP